MIGGLSLLTWNGPQVTTSFAVYVALFVAVGAPALTTTTGLLTLVQTHAAPAVRGRVLSTVFAVFGGVQALGMMVAGLVGTGAGLTTALEVQGGLYLAAALVARGLVGRAVNAAGRPAVAERPRIRHARAAA